MPRHFIAICAAVAVLRVFATDEAVTCDRFPDADAVLLDDATRIEYRPDGTSVETRESHTKILTEKGRRDERTISLCYSKRYGEASIDQVRVVGADGSVREVDIAATSREATDNDSMSANIYDPLDRRIVCLVPGLAVGDTLYVKTTRRTLKPRCQDQWADVELLESTCPILRASVEIRAPRERPLKRKAVRNPLGNVTASETPLPDGGTLHVFVATNSPQAFPDPDMPPLYTQIQNLRVSTAADWSEISRWYWDLCAPHLAKTNAAMAAKVAELRGSGDDDAAIRAIFRFVSQEVRYMGLTMEDTSPGYAPHDVDITFSNRYGVCRDKAGLLVAMLRMAGFNAFPTLINVGAKLDPEVPQPFFNHAIVAVETPQGILLMDPTNENAKDLLPAYESDKSYLVCRPEGDVLRTSPTPPSEHNALKAATTGTLAKDGSLVLEHDLSFCGINDTAYRAAFARMTDDDRMKFFERAVRRLAPGTELLRCTVEPTDMRDTEKPIRVRLSERIPEAVLRGKTSDRLAVPFIAKTMGVANFMLSDNTSLEKRRFPLVVDCTALVDETVSIDLAECVGAVAGLPATVASECAALSFARSFAVSNGVLTAHRVLAVEKVEISPAEYIELREELKRIEAAERRECAFESNPLAEADVRWIDRSVEVDVASDICWTVTNRVVKEVLTYQGKRTSAELKLSYAPCVESLELVSATVSNRDGRVLSVSPREINEMDCGWAAGAPRYPASRLLVANLPGVEIGSVISYTTVRTVTNAPAAFYATFRFDSHDPSDRIFVRVNDWSREMLNAQRLPDEPGQPAAALWRDEVVFSFGHFQPVDLKIPEGDDLPSPKFATGADVRAIRDWMARHVKIVGPGMYEIPLARQLTDPRQVLRDGYASRLDYIRTLCALLRAAGHEADVVFAAGNADAQAELRTRDKYVRPNVRAFASALCRVRKRNGGFCGFGETITETFIGTESEYAPIGPTAFAGSDYFDPTSGEFGVVTVSNRDFSDRTEETRQYVVRENGAVDVSCTSSVWGSGVGSFRKLFSEILPEDRSRLHQNLLGQVSQAASATSDIEADVKGYPATRRYSCYVPDFAVRDGDTMTISLPSLLSTIPAYVGTTRKTPFAVGAANAARERVTVKFPRGYASAEHLPEPFEFIDPKNPDVTWMRCTVSSKIVDNALEVEVVREASAHGDAWLPASAFGLVRDWSSRAAARASRTISVRRQK